MKPMSATSQRKRTQLRKEDQERTRWRTRMAVNRREDCQAWNLHAHCQHHFQPQATGETPRQGG